MLSKKQRQRIVKKYLECKARMREDEEGRDELEAAENIVPCNNADDFVGMYIWAVVHAGLSRKAAKAIEGRVLDAIDEGRDLSTVLRHDGKRQAIESMLENREEVFKKYRSAKGKVAFLGNLPWVGEITKWHMAKYLGALDCIKPDRHVVRIAEGEGTTPDELARVIQEETGDSLAMIDTVLWFADLKGWW